MNRDYDPCDELSLEIVASGEGYEVALKVSRHLAEICPRIEQLGSLLGMARRNHEFTKTVGRSELAPLLSELSRLLGELSEECTVLRPGLSVGGLLHALEKRGWLAEASGNSVETRRVLGEGRVRVDVRCTIVSSFLVRVQLRVKVPVGSVAEGEEARRRFLLAGYRVSSSFPVLTAEKELFPVFLCNVAEVLDKEMGEMERI
ncbi:hypothetical protein [Thermofilum pendens]|uniref:Uncharacterized protein n=1 Tax=Thermofilum pendens (strain DSM 2475 / Hrk 5) TaxID=368408 RepID=A1RYK8_THEPD|nr:hypothetical protein [Thermofilum pendens]ABL78288.1 hypothetical protein Tpen_0887 [Thermofilum pendens Hrk 5]